MNAQRSVLLRQSIDSEQRRFEEAKKACILEPCADDNELASGYETAHANICLMQHLQKRLTHLNSRAAVLESRPSACCLECGEAIEARRLEAVPDAVRCAACQAEWEDGQKYPLGQGRTQPEARGTIV